jgi:hypothetical protein
MKKTASISRSAQLLCSVILLMVTKNFEHFHKKEFFHLLSISWHFLPLPLPQLFGQPDHYGKVGVAQLSGMIKQEREALT